VAAGKKKAKTSEPTAAQQQTMYNIVFALCGYFGIPYSAVVGHGEIQRDKWPSEGLQLAQTIRSWVPRTTGV